MGLLQRAAPQVERKVCTKRLFFNMASWSHSAVAEFIGIYRSEECLWKLKSPSYSNRFCKEQAYNKLLEFVRTFDREATKEIIIKKINSLRSSFRKELNKVKSSSGSGADEVYIPKLWYYNDLLFLQVQEQTRVACSSLQRSSQVEDITFIKQDTSEDRISVAESTGDLSENLDVADSESTPTPTPEPRQIPELRPEARTELRPGQSNITRNRTIRPGQSNITRIRTWNRTRNRTSLNRKSDDDELLKIALQRLLSSATAMPNEDQFDAFGKLMAHKMRNLPHDQRVLAERLCHDVMLDAELDNLTRQTRVVNQST